MISSNQFNVHFNIEDQHFDVQFTRQSRQTRHAIEIGDDIYTYSCPANQRQRVQQVVKQALSQHPHSVAEFKESVSYCTSHANLHPKPAQAAAGIIGPSVQPATIVSGPISEAMDAYLQNLHERGHFHGTVRIIHRGQVILSKGYGKAVGQTENTPQTIFQIGSCSKQFTAAAIMKLHEMGLLDLENASINNYLPEAYRNPAWDKVTIHHLLTHSSGIPNYTNPKSCPEYASHKEQGYRHFSLDEVVGLFHDKPLEFEPGEKSVYCNSGFVLCGAIIAHMNPEGLSYGEFVTKRIFGPAGMASSGIYEDAAYHHLPRAQGRRMDAASGTLLEDTFAKASEAHAAGGLYSTAEDMAKWSAALDGTHVLSSASIERMETPNKEGWGYGLVIEKGHIGHSGAIPGFRSYFRKYPKTEDCIIVLGNNYELGAERIGHDLEQILYGHPERVPSVIPDRRALHSPAMRGTFHSRKRNEDLRFDVRGSKVYFQGPFGAETALLPLSNGRYLNGPGGQEFAFQFDAKGRVNKIEIYERGALDETITRK